MHEMGAVWDINNNNQLTNGSDFDMKDIDNNIEDHDSDPDTDDDDVENEAYYNKQDLDPFTIIQELCEAGDIYSLKHARYLIEKEEMRRNKVTVYV